MLGALNIGSFNQCVGAQGLYQAASQSDYFGAQQRAMSMAQAGSSPYGNNSDGKFLGTYMGEEIYTKSKSTKQREYITNMGIKNKKAFKSNEELFDELIEKYKNY